MPEKTNENEDVVSNNVGSMIETAGVCLGLMLVVASIVLLSGTITTIAGLLFWVIYPDPVAISSYASGSRIDSMPARLGAMASVFAGTFLIFGIMKLGTIFEFWVMKNVSNRYTYNIIRETIFVGLGVFIGLYIFILNLI